MSLPSRERGLKLEHKYKISVDAASLPSRERGLKSRIGVPGCPSSPSLPSRERGLKYPCASPYLRQKLSLPSRERGLKFISNQQMQAACLVAPLAGAWIEIGKESYSNSWEP